MNREGLQNGPLKKWCRPKIDEHFGCGKTLTSLGRSACPLSLLGGRCPPPFSGIFFPLLTPPFFGFLPSPPFLVSPLPLSLRFFWFLLSSFFLGFSPPTLLFWGFLPLPPAAPFWVLSLPPPLFGFFPSAAPFWVLLPAAPFLGSPPRLPFLVLLPCRNTRLLSTSPGNRSTSSNVRKEATRVGPG